MQLICRVQRSIGARANTHFPDRIAHGVMTTALMSKPLVQFCERFKIRTALLSTNSKYIRPVVAGDTVTTTIQLTEKLDERKRIRFEVKCTNQNGDDPLGDDGITVCGE